MTAPTAIAIAAHPDDIELKMGGTLLLLKQAGWDIHYFNLSSGNGGSLEYNADDTAAIRREEAQEAAKRLGATWHPPIADDLLIFYQESLLRQVAAVIREVRPSIVLTHPLEDYMEDHMETARLAVTGAFAHCVRNFRSSPEVPPYFHDVTVYHCMPHGGRDPLRRPVIPGAWVNTTSVHAAARHSLAAHHSQGGWLDATQGQSSYLDSMDEHARSVGRQSGSFEFAEGWWRHLHVGFSNHDIDPLADALGENYLVNAAFEKSLEINQILP